MKKKATGETRKAVDILAAGAENILESISDGVFTVDSQWRITSFNRAAESITGIRRRDAVGRPCPDVFRASMCETGCALRQTMRTGKPIVNRHAFIVDATGRRIPVSVSTALLRDASGRITGGAETFRDLSLVEQLRRDLEGRFQIGDIVSRSPAMRRISDVIPQVAASEASVLIHGETGTGKELLARAIHGLSPRRAKPFVPVNCGAFPETLLESELFGYMKGAFTGASRDKPGRFAMAEGGTVFLDEIGDISPAFQVRLLRVLQERTYEPLGGTRSMRADIRVIAASNRDLRQLVAEGSFREDLFYRLNVIRLDLPPLRDRLEDIPLLVAHFTSRMNARQGRAIEGATPEALAVLMSHHYPGNVRELENIIERAFILCQTSSIEPSHLPRELAGGAGQAYGGGTTQAGTIAARKEAAEKQAIIAAMERNGFNRLATARELGLHKTTLFRKIRKLGIKLPLSGRQRMSSEKQM